MYMYYAAIQMILILHDSGVLCKLHISDHELDHFSCPVLVHDSNVVFTHVVKCNALFSGKQIAMIRYGFFTVHGKFHCQKFFGSPDTKHCYNKVFFLWNSSMKHFPWETLAKVIKFIGSKISLELFLRSLQGSKI